MTSEPCSGSPILIGLHRYPIKGCRALSVQQALVQERGLYEDRRWMVVDEQGVFCTQRTLPELGTLAVQVDEQGLSIDDTLQVPNPGPDAPRVEVRVWKDQVTAALADPSAHPWISKRLGQSLRLVRMDARSIRQSTTQNAVSFADGHPILVTNTASLADLHRRMGEHRLSMAAFRPNLVVASQSPWAEDQWKTLRIGSVTLELVSPCVRCKVTTLDPINPHLAHPQMEPLKTLATFRRQGKGVTFGWNAQLRGAPGDIWVGQAVAITLR